MTPNPNVVGKKPEEQSPLLTHRKDRSRSINDDQLDDDKLPGLCGHEDHNEEVYHLRNPELKVYARRWWVLGVFASLSFVQSCVWITWSTFSVSAKDVFGWTDNTIALLVDWGNLPYIILLYPLCWLLDVKGLRISTLMASFLTVVATALRCITSETEVATPLIHVAHIINGVSGVVFTGAPAHLSAAWFPSHQRTTATSISVLVNYLGIAFGYLMGPIFVPHPPMPTCNNISWHSASSCDNATLVSDYIKEERDQIMKLMYYEAGAATLLFLAALAYFPSRPPKPPTASATQERMKIGTTLVKLLKNRNFWFIALGYSVTNAVTGNWLGVLGPALEPFGITQEQTGVMGMASTLAGALSSLILARFVDYLGGKIKCCLIIILTLGLLNFTWYTLLYMEVFVPTLGRLYPAVIFAGVVAYAGSPLYMELCVEVSYPCQEGVVGLVLQTIMNLLGSIFLGIFLIPNIGVSWMNWALIGSTVVGILLAVVQRENYHRSAIDRAAGRTQYEAINSSDPEDV